MKLTIVPAKDVFIEMTTSMPVYADSDLAFFTPDGRLVAVSSAVAKTTLVKVLFYQTFEEEAKFFGVFRTAQQAAARIQEYFEEF